jgi:putative ABC transport system ATP-binding protein
MKTNESGSLTVAHVSVSFSRWGQTVKAVDDVSFEVPSGQWLLVVGPNGAGKSTLLKVIAGYVVQDKGSITIGKRSVRSLRPRQLAESVFMVQQDPLLGTASLLTVFENLYVADTSAIRDRKSRSALRSRYTEMLTPIGLAARLDQPVKLLSGGERQLLAMTISALREAKIILLDEPLAALDTTKSNLCIQQIVDMHRDGKTIIQISHDIESLEVLAERILTLTAGRLLSDQLLRDEAANLKKSLLRHE